MMIGKEQLFPDQSVNQVPVRVMGLGNHGTAVALVFLSFFLNFGAAIDTITSSHSIKDPETIASPGNEYKLGFFSPVNSTKRYVGIWYSGYATKPVWVANRNRPINDSSGVLTIAEDGNLVVLNGRKEILWSSNVSNGVGNSTAQLTDDGNLVLQGSSDGNILWQSFQQPSDTYLMGMQISSNAVTGEKTLLTSWLSPSDPSIGSFSGGLNPLGIPEMIIWNDSHPFWRSTPWIGHVFIGIPQTSSVYLSGFNVQDGGDGSFTISSTNLNKTRITFFVLGSDGKFVQLYGDYGTEDWETRWQVPENECDFYGKCGPFGICNAQNSQICSCLKGFEPKNADEWNRGNWTSGCIRRTLLQCDSVRNGSVVGKEDGFLKLEMMKVPAFAEFRSSPSSEQECQDECLNNCSCVAYSYYQGFGCMSWTGNLIDIQKLSSAGADLCIRLAYSELDNKRNMKEIISISVIVGVITISVGLFLLWRLMARQRESKSESKRIRKEVKLSRSEISTAFTNKEVLKGNLEKLKLQELPVFDLEKLAAATNNFEISNKIGQGGFGPVYRGKLPDGQEIAVKRLSRSSGQGVEEFMNEVVVISKLQHRNLVRLIGCCVKGEEKMLVYEYMPNKSLDALLFDPLRKELLDWKIRFNIVEGICRGLLYLHRDSRLRIIHRDLKASNILLDQDLNSKISDFGMARIFGGIDDLGSTKRIVGTYGYMSPEYAMEGRFSEKSDIFSFGVLLLEIISGRRNTSFYGNEQALSLLIFAWKLWNEGSIATLVDPVISNPCFQEEILRCIHVGLLCVQEFAKDRPSVSTVISMLNSEIVDLPIPKQPGFTERENFQQSQDRDSINSVTFTDPLGR